jgi:transcriptional regulator with XRE-family HTH domain
MVPPLCRNIIADAPCGSSAFSSLDKNYPNWVFRQPGEWIRIATMNRVREWRQRRGLSIEELARRSRTSPSQISKLERGERRLTLDWMSRLAKALSCRREDLLPNDLEGAPSSGSGGPLDRELLRRMGRALMKHLREEGQDLAPPRFLDTAIALHDLIAARPGQSASDELPPEMKPVIRLISGD